MLLWFGVECRVRYFLGLSLGLICFVVVGFGCIVWRIIEVYLNFVAREVVYYGWDDDVYFF